MTDKDIFCRLADDLASLLKGGAASEDIRARYWKSHDESIEAIMANVEHYLSDGDIRLRDSDYRLMQDGEMVRLIEALRRGDVLYAKRVTFLGRTRNV